MLASVFCHRREEATLAPACQRANSTGRANGKWRSSGAPISASPLQKILANQLTKIEAAQ
ncbi:MAG: hypothetical protein ACR650_07135 [Methylocystis sp.]|jgi:hypothetical protein